MKIGYVMQEGAPDVRQKPLTGPANHVLRVYQQLQALGHEMVFLARYDGIIWRSKSLESFLQVSVSRRDHGLLRTVERVVRGVQSRLHLPYINYFESLRFAQACIQELSDCEILYERMGWMGYACGIAAKRMNIPLIIEANNGDFITELERLGNAPDGLQRYLSIKLMKNAAHRCSHVIATGDGHRNRFIKWYGIAPDKVTTVENGTEMVNILSREQLTAFNDNVAKKPHPKLTIAFVGAFEPWHGIPVLLDALKIVIEKLPHIRLILIGSGTQNENILQQIETLNLDNYVELTGQQPIEKVADYLAKSDIGVAPYCGWMEFSGLKLFDYKAAGLAIIASGEGRDPATLKHGVTALIVPPCEPEPLADAITRLALDPGLRIRLGQLARNEAEEFHSWRCSAIKIEKLCYQVLNQWQ